MLKSVVLVALLSVAFGVNLPLAKLAPTLGEVLPLAELSASQAAPAHLPNLTEVQYAHLFSKWAEHHNRFYEADELEERYENFKVNLDKARKWNAEKHSFKLAMNQFGDWSMEEYKRKMLPSYMKIEKPEPARLHKSKNVSASTVDWRTKGVVTPIKNQGQCGSCWSFSTTGSTEGAQAIATGNLVSLSEQDLMDCSTSEGNQSCEGGLMTQAFQYIISNGGIDTEQSYPYLGEDESTCNYVASNSGATIKGFNQIPQYDEKSLANAVASVGPVSVAIDANHNSFMQYSSGVFSIDNCHQNQLDHGVLAVGYGVDSATGYDYWIVKNSWGTSWGMEGYIWMRKDYNNMCGIATSASYPTGAGPGVARK
jgi:cathepsin L